MPCIVLLHVSVIIVVAVAIKVMRSPEKIVMKTTPNYSMSLT
ncbi:hypothetical protein [Coleofasciculus chthonoplastes]